jgi:hypothetical protein
MATKGGLEGNHAEPRHGVREGRHSAQHRGSGGCYDAHAGDDSDIFEARFI